MTPSSLTIQLFGPMRILVDGEALPRVRARSVEWLLALLVLRGGRAVDRAWLAGTLWLDSEESQALHNLRNALFHLRKALGREGARLQSPTRDTLLLDLEEAEVDILAFDRAIQAGDEASLRSATTLYVGPLLEGCYEEWITLERQSREQTCLVVLERLAEFAEQRGDYTEALSLLRRAEAMDGLRDTTQRSLMRILTAGGDTPAALMAYREYRLRLQHEMNAEPDAETTRLFRQIRKVESPTPNAQRHTSDARFKIQDPLTFSAIPHPLTALIGREKEIADIENRLEQSRLVTLVGAGGVGKTRLAMEVAARMEDTFHAGAVWVEFAPLTEGALVLPAIAAALGIRQQQGAEEEDDLVAHILVRLAGGRFLLALDNCEHLVDAAALVVERLGRGCVGLHVLATSRQRLGLAGEVVWYVPSLSAPELSALPAEDASAVAHALTYPAVWLFVERAASARPGFRLSDRENAAAICTLCRRLDGIPLAIELAAARVGALTPVQLAARLDDRFALLTQGTRTALPRQKTLRALIDWSYDLLTEAERAILRILTVFADGWTLQSAEQVCALQGRREGGKEGKRTIDSRFPGGEDSLHSFPPSLLPSFPDEVLDLLSSLTEKSLIVSEEQADGMRYRMLETIREYAWERLGQAGEKDVARQRFLEWAVAFAESAYAVMLGPQPEAALDRMEAEVGNLRTALAFAQTCDSSPETCLRLGAALWPFWEMRGYVLEGRSYLLAAVERPNLPDVPARAHALLGAAALLMEQDFSLKMIALLRESLERFRALGDTTGTASALLLLAHVGLRLPYTDHPLSPWCDYAEQCALLRESLVRCREAGWVQAGALVLVHLGLLAEMHGDTEQSRALREEGESLLDRGDDGRTPVYYLNSMNNLAIPLYAHAGERALLEKSLVPARKTGNKRRVVAIVQALGKVAEGEGDAAFAIACLLEVAQTFREMGNAHALSEILQQMGNLYYHNGDYYSACPIYAESLELFRNLGYSVERSANNLGSTLFHLGEPERAKSLHREALVGYGSNIEGIAWSLERLAVVEALRGDPRNAAWAMGVAAGARKECGRPKDKWDQEDWDCAAAVLGSVLGKAEFDRLFEAACVADWQQAIERILRES